jgi:hypothetical protein
MYGKPLSKRFTKTCEIGVDGAVRKRPFGGFPSDMHEMYSETKPVEEGAARRGIGVRMTATDGVERAAGAPGGVQDGAVPMLSSLILIFQSY